MEGQAADLTATIEEAIGDIEVQSSDSEIGDDVAEERRQSTQAPVVKTVNLVLQEAIKQKASDIHFEPRANHLEIRYRIDGALPAYAQSAQAASAGGAEPYQDHGRYGHRREEAPAGRQDQDEDLRQAGGLENILAAHAIRRTRGHSRTRQGSAASVGRGAGFRRTRE